MSKKSEEERIEKRKIEAESEEEFIRKAALDVISQMAENDKQYMRENPEPSLYHFGLGMWIRNTYIHGMDLRFGPLGLEPMWRPDDLSYMITKEIVRILTDGADENGNEEKKGEE